jgi:two-component system phosphate regulon sensor histidine kinase PhoR
MFRSIRWRIAVPYVLLILFSMLGLQVYLSGFVRQTYMNDLQSQLANEARLAGSYITPELWQTDPTEDYLDQLSRQWADLLGARLTIVDIDGTVLGESHENRQNMDNHLNRPEIAQALKEGQGSSRRFSATVGYQMMYTAVAIKDGENPLGVVRVALPLQQVEANITHLQRISLLATFIAAVLAIVLAILISGRITRPVRELTEVASQLADGKLVEKTLPETGDEVGQLMHAFNRMKAMLDNHTTLESAANWPPSCKMTDGGSLLMNRCRDDQPSSRRCLGLLLQTRSVIFRLKPYATTSRLSCSIAGDG